MNTYTSRTSCCVRQYLTFMFFVLLFSTADKAFAQNIRIFEQDVLVKHTAPTFGQLLKQLMPSIRVTENGDDIHILLSSRYLRSPQVFRSMNPLFILNGVHIGNDASLINATISPNMIKRIEIIRDSSAMRYGINAQYGVVIVETF